VNLLDYGIFRFLFKNKYMLNLYRLLATFLFVYAIIYGIINPTKENIFTNALFWSLFWPFFMTITLPTFGKLFCMICPHGFIARVLNKYSLNIKLPSFLANPYIGLFLSNILLYWVVIYTFPGLLNQPLFTSLFFLFFTILVFVFSISFKGISYCKYICPIGSVNTAFARTGFTWLSTIQEDCKSCKTLDCVKACQYGLNPSKFDERKSMYQCTLCMDCANACNSVQLNIVKWGYSLYEKIKNPKMVEIAVYIVLTGVITFTMRFHHGLSRTGLADSMPWVIVGKDLQQIFSLPKWIDMVGFIALIMGTLLAVILGYGSFYIISRLLRKDFKEITLTLGYAFAPLMIVGGLSHVLEFFFIEYYHNIINGFSQAFNLGIHVEPLAKRGEPWLNIFKIFPFIAGFWSLYILWKRTNFITQDKKALVFSISSALPVVYILLTIFTIWAFINYPPTTMMHHHHH